MRSERDRNPEHRLFVLSSSSTPKFDRIQHTAYSAVQATVMNMTQSSRPLGYTF